MVKIRILGAHNLETARTRHTCFLVDDTVAIDAGSLMTGLADHERDGLRVVLLTHRHFDHVRDLPSYGLATMDNGATVDVRGIDDTLDAVTARLLDGLLYPDFTRRPTPERPKYRLSSVKPGVPFTAAGLRVRPVAMPHGAPAVGYVVGDGGASAAFTGDTGGGLAGLLSAPEAPRLLFTEVTFSDASVEQARRSGHLTPSLLGGELEGWLAAGGAAPRVVVVHRDARHEAAMVRELAAVSERLGVEIVIGAQDQVLEL